MAPWLSPVCLALGLACLLTAAAPARADRSPAWQERAVDAVKLRRGPLLLGTIVEQSHAGELLLAVSRAWLRRSDPAYFESAAMEEQAEQRAALAELQPRLARWIEQRPEPPALTTFLNSEARRLARLASRDGEPSAGESEFLLIRMTRERIERGHVQPPERRQIALIAWREGLADVETRTARALRQELRERRLDPAVERVDLSDRLPVLSQSEEEWAARRAIVEYQYREPLEFQGSGSLVVRTGGGAKAPALAELLASTLKSQLAGQLEDLWQEPGAPRARDESKGWMDSAIRTADDAGVDGFRVTRVAPDTTAGRVTVETRFVARMPEGGWRTVWQHTESLEGDRVDPALRERVANDPTVKQALALLQTAGIAADDALQTALHFGAATLQAQQEADARFFEFRDRCLRRLDGPPLRLPPAEASDAPNVAEPSAAPH